MKGERDWEKPEVRGIDNTLHDGSLTTRTPGIRKALRKLTAFLFFFLPSVTAPLVELLVSMATELLVPVF